MRIKKAGKVVLLISNNIVFKLKDILWCKKILNNMTAINGKRTQPLQKLL